MTARLLRSRRIFERHWPWLVLSLLGSTLLFGVLLLLELGVLAELSEYLERSLRGYTPVGVLLGAWTVFLIFFGALYAARKRGLQEHWPLGRATMVSWLWAHVYWGLFAWVTACAHAGYGALSWQLSSGKLLLFSLGLLVGSGVVWRLVYAFVPGMAATSVGNYSRRALNDLSEQLDVELEKQVAGRGPALHDLKQRLAAYPMSPAELEQALRGLPEPEWQPARELFRLEQQKRELAARMQRQVRFTRLLQGSRVLHVPVVLLVLALLPVHVLFAYDVPARLLEPGAFSATALGGFETADTCQRCHARIVAEWRTSMHAHAMTSPLMIAQTNQAVPRALAGKMSPDPAKVCVNCHGPIGAALTDSATLPLSGSALQNDALLNEGISCAVCHQWDGTSRSGGAGLAAFADGLEPGRTYFGPIADPVANAFHRSERRALFDAPERLCQNCHVVQLDKNGDGNIVKGSDLVLQTLFDEWRDYAKNGGATCISCHMPVQSETRAAEAASLVFEQDREAPARVVHDHSFVGVDQPLELAPAQDPQRGARGRLLARAATLELFEGSLVSEPAALSFSVKLTNSGVGHYLPGGFAFVRQMWLEVTIEDGAGGLVAASGLLEKPSDDLCDASILDDSDNPMRPLLSGCARSDALLVNLQQQLVDVVEVDNDELGNPRLDERNQPKLVKAERGREVALQYLDGGPVPRRRAFDKKPMPPLAPGEVRAFAYRFATPASRLARGRLKVRLLFRAVPPYFVRALAAGQRPEEPRVLPLIDNIAVYEMASFVQDIR